MENNVNLVDLLDKSQGLDVKTEIMMKLFNEIYEERKKFKELVKKYPNDMDLGKELRSMVS